MYQLLIWAAVLGNEARGLAAALDPEDMERAPNALIHGMGGNAKLVGDFFGREMLVDEQ